MHHVLTCSCGAKHLVTVSQAGQSLACACGNSLSIPTLRGLKELPLADDQAKPAPRAIDRPSASRPSILVGMMFLLFFVAGGMAIFFGYQRLKLDTSKTLENVRSQAFKQIDEANPVQISHAWEQYSATRLGVPTKPEHYYVEARRDSLNLQIIIAASVALLAAVIAGGTLTARKLRSSN